MEQDKKDFDERENSPEAAANEVIRETGFVQTSPTFSKNDALKYIHDYLNVLPYEDCLQSDNYFICLLALLDQRLGKRRLKKMVENIEQEPEWFRKWVMLRATAECLQRLQKTINPATTSSTDSSNQFLLERVKLFK